MEIADREVLLRSGKDSALRTKLADRRRRPHFLRAPTSGRSPAKCSAGCVCAIAEIQGLTKGSEQLDFLWVTDFPLLQFDATENKWNAVHHPFTRPKAEDLPLLEEKRYGEMRAEAYDVVLNGVEIGGGSIRIHEPDLQAKMFAVLGVSEEDSKSCLVISCALSASARRRTAASRSASIASSCSICGEEIDPRRDRLPEKQSRPGPDVAVARRRRSAPVARSRNSARGRVGRAILAAPASDCTDRRRPIPRRPKWHALHVIPDRVRPVFPTCSPARRGRDFPACRSISIRQIHSGATTDRKPRPATSGSHWSRAGRRASIRPSTASSSHRGWLMA